MRERLFIAVLLALATGFLYAPTLDFELLDYDDHKYLTLHHHVRKGLTVANLEWAFTTFHFSNWHPVTWLSYLIDQELFGLSPAGLHGMNAGLHVLATLLLFGWLSDATGCVRRSGFVAALFALHPLHVESVAWVSERKDVLSAIFGFAALWSYLAYARRGGAVRYALVTLWLGLGLMSKSTLVTFPVLFLLLDAWPLGRVQGFGAPREIGNRVGVRRLLLEKLPWLLLSGLTSWLTVRSQDFGGAIVSRQLVPLHLRVENALVSTAKYLGKTVWPDGLTIAYPHPYLSGGTPLTPIEVGVSVVVFAGCSLAAWHWRSRGYPLVGWLWFLGVLAPASGLVAQVGSQAMADRYTYLPHVGLFIAVVWGVTDWVCSVLGRDRSVVRAGGVAGMAVVFLYATMAWSQVHVWRNDVTLILHALQFEPRHAVLHSALGREYLLEERYEESLRHYRIAAALDPRDPDSHFALAEALTRVDDFPGARVHFEQCLSIDPAHLKARKGVGALMLVMGEFEVASGHLGFAVKRSPRDSHLRMNLAQALAGAGRPVEAIEQYRAASDLNPRWAVPLIEMAWLLATHPDSEVREGGRAVETAQRAVAIAKGRADYALASLAAAHAEVGEYDAAVRTANQALARLDEAKTPELASALQKALLDYRNQRPHRDLWMGGDLSSGQESQAPAGSLRP
ncbi:tetratricopeptide repeat protein [Myxococcota bacterium]|nr:tetratricopeptide repeat protein [Myxococcota bacterium]